MNPGTAPLFVHGIPWALEARSLAVLSKTGTCDSFARRIAAVERRPGQAGEKVGYVAVIPVRGVITKRESLRQKILGGTSIQALTAQFRKALNDRGVVAIIFDFDSPGGEISGTMELADEILRARDKKQIAAVANSAALGAAYWLASSAGELAVAPSGYVGSIGMEMLHTDYSVALAKSGIKITILKAGRFKTEGNESEPLSAGARDDMQKKMDSYYGQFVDAVARGRGTNAKRVRSKFGQGRSVLAGQAFRAGMVDGIETLDQMIRRIGSGVSANQATAASYRRCAEQLG
jgi:signal peptide peptidase SppA